MRKKGFVVIGLIIILLLAVLLCVEAFGKKEEKVYETISPGHIEEQAQPKVEEPAEETIPSPTPEMTREPEPTEEPESAVTLVPICCNFSVGVEPEGAGRLNSEKNGTYEQGTEIRVVVRPLDEYIFSGWYVGEKLLGSDRSIKITLSEDTHLRAVFLTPTPTPSPVKIEESKKGDIIVFGSYEQDNDMSNGPEAIEWIVLKEEDGKMLLLSRYVLDTPDWPFGWKSGAKNREWENSYWRVWLNKNFYDKAFSSEEKQRIVETEIKNLGNKEYGIEGGPTTRDKIFLLSMEEVEEFYPKESAFISERKGLGTKATEYAIAQGGRVYTHGDYGYWWLRTPGYNDRSVLQVTANEVVWASTGMKGFSMRPVLWLQKE